MMRRRSALRREAMAAERVPYAAHVAPCIVSTVSGDFVQTLRLSGTSFETQDDAALNSCHERLNVLWRNIGAPNIALWTHVVRRRTHARLAAPSVGGGFAGGLARKYAARLDDEILMSNELYVSLVYRPLAGAAAQATARLLKRARHDLGALARADALEHCEKLAQTLQASLARYEPWRLGVYSGERGTYSSLLEFLALLLNGEPQPMPLPTAPLYDVLMTSRVLFGGETIEYRSATGTRVAAVLGIKEYPTPTVVGMYNRLLSAPFAFVLAQSFTFLTKSAGQGLLMRQFNRMANAGDFSLSQADELKVALDGLTSNEFVMGDHHFTLQVFAEADPDERNAQRLRPLNESLSIARSLLADTGMVVAREDLAVEAAFWAQLPGEFAFRTRKAPITSRNLAAMAPFHNFPQGRRTGNHWGEALCALVSSASAPYYFSLHASDPKEADGGSRKDTGHTLICGPTGSGKTVFVGFLLSALSRGGTTQVIFDKDRGLEILVRALGGDYLPLRGGEPTGFNPLQLPVTPGNHEFLRSWLCALASPGGAADRPFSARETTDLEQALQGTLQLAAGNRRLSRLVEFLDPTDPDGLHARLARWCEGTGGDYAWAFDNARDSVVARLEAQPLMGFDVSEFLDNALLRAPVTLYLFHLVRLMLDGRRLVCWMDEFWRLLGDAAFAAFAKDGPKTWRKLNGVMCLATQSASDVLDSDISRTLVEQTPTKIFFPNPAADHDEYVHGFGLSEREFCLIKQELDSGSRTFLVKQSHESIVCRLDLQGFDAELKVISGRKSELSRMHACIAQSSAHPDHWLPLFLPGHASGAIPNPNPTSRRDS